MQTSVFQDVAAYDFASPGFNLTGDRPEQLHGIHVTEGYFRLFGAPAMLGRTFTPQEDSPHGGNVVVLSYGFWQRRFGGDPAIVGKWLSLGNEPYTIVGVIGKEFFSDPDAEIWLPFQFDPDSTNGNHYFQVAARLKPGITLAAANAQMKLATDEYYRLFPISNRQYGQIFAVEPLRDLIIGDARNSLLIMLGAVGLVLLIACANVANLLLVRATGRKREFAIRSALGAGRGRIVRQLLTESVLLSLAGATLGLVLGFAGVRALLAVSPAGLPRIGEDGSAMAMDWRVLGFTLAVSLLTGILFGLFPAFTASRTDLNSTLKESSSRSGTGFRQGKARSLLVISEVSLALVLLIGAALLIRTFIALRAVSPGFDAHNVLTMEMSHQRLAPEHDRGDRSALAGRPQPAQCHPRSGSVGRRGAGCPTRWKTLWASKSPDIRRRADGRRWMSITPGYLMSSGFPSCAGAISVKTTRRGARRGAHQSGLGQQILARRGPHGTAHPGRHRDGGQPDEPPRTIIGIVGDTHNSGLGQPPDPMMMVPIAQVADGYTAAYSNISAALLGGANPRRPAPCHCCHHRTVAHRQRRIPGGAYPHHGRGDGALHGARRASICCCSPFSARWR